MTSNDLMGNAITEFVKRISGRNYNTSELREKLTAYDEIVSEAIRKFAEGFVDEEEYVESQQALWLKLTTAEMEKARSREAVERRMEALKMLNELEQ